MISLMFGLALASEPLPRHFEVDLTLGMRAGVAGLASVEPTKHLEAGGMMTVTTDVYAGAPAWVRSGLEAKHNLHVAPMAVFGVNTGRKLVNLSVLGAAGVEINSFREARTVSALPDPVIYGTTGARFSGGLVLDLRVRREERVGANVQLFVPLPLAPTGSLYVHRIHLGAGVSF